MLILEPTPEPTAPATVTWPTPTPRPTIESEIAINLGENLPDMNQVIYGFTDDMVAGYNSVRPMMDTIVLVFVAFIALAMLYGIMRKIRNM